MNAKELKAKLIEIFGKQIIFNKEFNNYSESIKNIDEILLKWCRLVANGDIKALRAPKQKDEIVFIKKIGSSNRCIIIKIKNKEFKEIHLADHSYYDKLRKILGLKKDNKTY